MAIIRKLTPDLIYTGVNDRRIALFENVYPVSAGVSYNSYVLRDSETVIFDTADGGFTDKYLQNVEAALEGADPSYLVVHHMEPDHSASIKALADKYPSMKIILNAKTNAILANYFAGLDERTVCVKDGEEMCVGKHTLKFVFAPMVHWPEVMFTYDVTDGILFSADAFGSFGAIDGSIYSDETDFEEYLPEARRYYTNIVGKYGVQVTNAIKKLAGAPVNLVCPLHGLVWRGNFEKILAYYLKWASYEPEENSVMIAYASIYGNTKLAAEILAKDLAERGVRGIKVFDLSKTHYSYLVAEAFRNSTIIVASVTYNAGLFPHTDTFLRELEAHAVKNRNFAFIQNGSWVAQSGAKMAEAVSKLKDARIVGETVTLNGAVKPATVEALKKLADDIAAVIL